MCEVTGKYVIRFFLFVRLLFACLFVCVHLYIFVIYSFVPCCFIQAGPLGRINVIYIDTGKNDDSLTIDDKRPAIYPAK